MPDTNFKDQDPNKQYSTPENPKDRSGGYDSGKDFDPSHGFDNHPDDYFTTDQLEDEDELLATDDDEIEDDYEDDLDDEDDDLDDEEFDGGEGFGDEDLDEDFEDEDE